MKTIAHSMVEHPNTLLKRCSKTKSRFTKLNERLLEFMSVSVLGSLIGFDLALIVPLVGLYGVGLLNLRDMVMIICSSWISVWALFGIQRLQVHSDRKRDAKNDVDQRSKLYQVHILEELAKKEGIDTNKIQIDLNNYCEECEEGIKQWI